VTIEVLAYPGAANRAKNDGNEGAQFDDAVPHESFFSGTSSGSNPYFDGPNSAA
jgi:hypothetical protein